MKRSDDNDEDSMPAYFESAAPAPLEKGGQVSARLQGQIYEHSEHCDNCIYERPCSRRKELESLLAAATAEGEQPCPSSLESLNRAFQCAYIECPAHVIDDLRLRFNAYLADVLAAPHAQGEQPRTSNGARTDYNEPLELAKQRVEIMNRIMKLPYIKQTRNTEEGEIRFVARDDINKAVHDYAVVSRGAAATAERTPRYVPSSPGSNAYVDTQPVNPGQPPAERTDADAIEPGLAEAYGETVTDHDRIWNEALSRSLFEHNALVRMTNVGSVYNLSVTWDNLTEEQAHTLAGSLRPPEMPPAAQTAPANSWAAQPTFTDAQLRRADPTYGQVPVGWPEHEKLVKLVEKYLKELASPVPDIALRVLYRQQLADAIGLPSGESQ